MSYTCLFYHIVFAVKDRQRPPREEQMKRIREYLAGMIRNRQARLYACNGPADHLHLLVALHPELCVSDFVQAIKAGSSKWFHETFENEFAWQDGYSAFSVSYSGLRRVMNYIQGQQEHHRTMTFEEELERFLQRHNVKYERKYL